MAFSRTVVTMCLVAPALSVLYAADAAQIKSRFHTRPSAGSKRSGADSFASEVAPLIKKYCASCHTGAKPAGGAALLTYHTRASVLKGKKIWERVSQNLSAATMPPSGAPQPSAAERDLIITWIDTSLSSVECIIKNPGRVTLRRLNREEYSNTIRDLIGADLRPAESFPSDDVGYGFDNIGDVLSISPLLMEKYIGAAEKVSQAAIRLPNEQDTVVHYGPEQMVDFFGSSQVSTKTRILMANGEMGVDYQFTKPGEYLVRVQAYQQRLGNDPARMSVRVDGNEVKLYEVKSSENSPGTFEVKATVQPGKRRVSVAFTNEYFLPNMRNEPGRRRYLAIAGMDVVGPVGEKKTLPPTHRKIIFTLPENDTPEARLACARKIMSEFARKAYRRPVSKDEVDRLVRYVDIAAKKGDPFERGIQLAVQTVLVSPNFLFRVEADPPAGAAGAGRPLNGFELVSRLSYFLWSSMPDDELFALAASGKINDPAVREQQIRRMLKSPKAHALVENFASQWLTLRNVSNANPDPMRFPMFNDNLRAAMRTETEMFFASIVKDDRSILDFLDGKFTFVNEPLAKLYGINGITGNQFQRVSLAGTPRAGLLTQASILTVTSNPTRTSPVKRGKWVLENLLGTPPPPPPPNVPELKERTELTGTLRQQMEQHRKDPNCATCHARLDQLGFGLENFDAVGAWRTKDGNSAVDASGVLPGGQKFSGPTELIAILKSKKVQFARCLAEKTLTYALGRGLESYDKCAIDDIVKKLTKRDFRYSALISAVVDSEPFRMRRSEPMRKAER